MKDVLFKAKKSFDSVIVKIESAGKLNEIVEDKSARQNANSESNFVCVLRPSKFSD